MPAAPNPLDAKPAPLPPPRRRRRYRQRRESAASRFGPRVLVGSVGVAALVGALMLAVRYPLGAIPAVAGVLLTALLARYFWTVWPGWMLGLLPCIGLAPWTGWMLVEEFDLLVLASVAGGYLAISGPHRHRPPDPVPVWRRELRWRRLTLALMVLFALSTAVSVLHGLVAGGGFPANLWAGYLESGTALRAGKPVLWMLLMLPLWQRVARRAPQTITPSLAVGTGLALAACAAGVVYERVAYTGLTNFSSDYRSTGFFWEMHMGGAALDGALALLLPFGLLGVLRLRGTTSFFVAVALLAAGSYAALATFSRGLYLALGLVLPLTLLLWVNQVRRAQRGETDPASSWLPGRVLPPDLPAPLPPRAAVLWLATLVAAASVAIWQMFPTSGYRGMLAVCGAMAALLVQPAAIGSARSARLLSSLLGAVTALPLLAVAALLAWSVDKAAYVMFALFWLGSVLMGRAAAQGKRPWASALGDALRAALWLATLGSAAVVAWSWGGAPALDASLLPLGLLALAWPLSQGGEQGRLMQGLSWRARGAGMAVLILVAAIVAALAGGAYVGDRLSRTEQDLGARFQHWSRTVAALDDVDGWLLGAGAGRFVPVFAMNAPADERIGDYRWVASGTPSLRLQSGTHVLGAGELLRVSQRLLASPSGLVLRFKAKLDEDAHLHVEICQKHLLYSDGCKAREVPLRPTDGWTAYDVDLGDAGELGRRGLVFSVALSRPAELARITDLSLRGSDGVELLRNGDFRQGLAHWFPSSDRHHLPWHAKSLPLHLLFEQGVVGLSLAVALFALAMGRLLLGAAREHPLAPALSGALLGFVLVGAFDSLVDAPRVALMFLCLLTLSLGLRAPPPPPLPKRA